MVSVVIAAHNEQHTIGRCLDALLAGETDDDLDVTVIANGCTDATAEVARARPGVRVVELAEPGKSRSLNAGDQVAIGFPRVYLDADIVLGRGELRHLVGPLLADTVSNAKAPLATAPGRSVDTRGCALLVRAYFAISTRLPAFQSGLFGRGAIALSQVGRSRFDSFPEMVADDLFLDSQFSDAEKLQVDAVSTVVAAPRTTRALVRRLIRVRRGNAEMRRAGAAGLVTGQIRDAQRWSWLRDVVLPNPRLAPAGLVYVAITLYAALQARRTGTSGAWGQDATTRGPEKIDHEDGSG